MRKIAIAAAGLFLILVAGCANTLSEEEAQQVAAAFLQGHVRFFPRGEEMNQTVQTVLEFSPDSYEAEDRYMFIVRASAQHGNKTVRNDLSVEVDKRSGKVVRFNGQPVA